MAVELAPTLDDAHRGLGDALAAGGRFWEAHAAFREAIRLSPGRARNHANYAVALYMGNRLDEAVEQFQEAARLDPDNSRHRSNLFGVLFRLGRFEQAADAALKAIQIEPTAHAFSNAGTQFFYAGDYQRAADLFRSAVELAPDDFTLHGNPADACRMSGSCEDWQEHYILAIELVDQRLAVNPDDSLARALRGLYNAHLGHRAEAVEDLDSALQAAPENADVLWAAAVCWGLLDDAEQSGTYARRALEAGFPLEVLRADPWTSILLVSVVAVGCAVDPNRGGGRVATCPANTPCVPVDPDRPGSVPFATPVSKTLHGQFSFLLQGRHPQGNTWLIFKCQVMTEQASDCRTPAADHQGNPLWAIRLDHGRLNAIGLADEPECSACLDRGGANCSANACRYPYMVIDLARPGLMPIDPVMIVRR